MNRKSVGILLVLLLLSLALVAFVCYSWHETEHFWYSRYAFDQENAGHGQVQSWWTLKWLM